MTATSRGLTPYDPRMTFPAVAPGTVIGLFGGSFDPPHAGHLHAAHMAITRLGLHQVWWMVTPANPLKRGAPPSDLKHRLDAVSAFAADPRIKVTAFEARLGVAHTARVLRFLRRRRPRVRFVWIMGGDNLTSFHRWQDWREIMTTTPVVVIDRPGARLPALRSKAAQTFHRARVSEDDARLLAVLKPPAWTLLTGPTVHQSSTALRAAGQGV